MAYKLSLPPQAKIHPVFHVSQLKQAVGVSGSVQQLPPTLTESLDLDCRPEKVLGIRNKITGNHTDSEVLIKWEGLPENEAT